MINQGRFLILSYLTRSEEDSLKRLMSESTTRSPGRTPLGSSNYEYVEVQSGIRPGDRIVLSDMSRFKESSSLRVR